MVEYDLRNGNCAKIPPELEIEGVIQRLNELLPKRSPIIPDRWENRYNLQVRRNTRLPYQKWD